MKTALVMERREGEEEVAEGEGEDWGEEAEGVGVREEAEEPPRRSAEALSSRSDLLKENLDGAEEEGGEEEDDGVEGDDDIPRCCPLHSTQA